MAAIEVNHDYHMVEPSPWPFVGSVATLIMAIGGVFWMHHWTPWVFFIGLAGVLYTMFAWWSDVIKESTGAFPRVVLAEGDYRAIARSDGRTYERNFKVITGVDGEVEVLAR